MVSAFLCLLRVKCHFAVQWRNLLKVIHPCGTVQSMIGVISWQNGVHGSVNAADICYFSYGIHLALDENSQFKRA